MRVRGLALGGSVDNAVVLGESKALNNDLRFVNEFVRHKILDVLGDLSLSGYFLKGHVMVHKGGHRLHAEMAKLLKTSLAVNEIESSEEGWSRTRGTGPSLRVTSLLNFLPPTIEGRKTALLFFGLHRQNRATCGVRRSGPACDVRTR